MIIIHGYIAVDKDDEEFRLHFTKPERRSDYWYSKNFSTLDGDDIPEGLEGLKFEDEPVSVDITLWDPEIKQCPEL